MPYGIVIFLPLAKVILYSPLKLAKRISLERSSNITAKQYHSPQGEYNWKTLVQKNKSFSGATDPIRTGDLLITSELLYQLSHSSVLAVAEQTQYIKFPHTRQEIFAFSRDETDWKLFKKKCFLPLTKGFCCVIVIAVRFGRVPEWPKGTDCKSAGFAFGGSNPPSPTK